MHSDPVSSSSESLYFLCSQYIIQQWNINETIVIYRDIERTLYSSLLPTTPRTCRDSRLFAGPILMCLKLSRCWWIQRSIHASRFMSQWQQAKQVGPCIFIFSHILQLFLGAPEAFPGQNYNPSSMLWVCSRVRSWVHQAKLVQTEGSVQDW